MYESIDNPQNLPMCVVLSFSFLKLCHDAIRNKSEMLAIWLNVRIVFKQIIVVQGLLNIEWCHFALISALKTLRRR